MEIGKINKLRTSRTTDNGCYLIDEEGEEVLLPNAYVPKSLKLGDDIEVFLYLDNEERPIATTLHPKVKLEEFAFLEVMDVNKAGAFLDMGLVKQLLVPYSEQPIKMEVGEKHVIFCLLDDKTDRLIGSARLEDFLFTEDVDVLEGDEVTILPYRRSELGLNVVVNEMYQGLIFKSDIHKPVVMGKRIEGYVKNVRADGKIDLLLEPQGYVNKIDKDSNKVLQHIKEQGGSIPFTDKSDPISIKHTFGMSKKSFKKALGNLYKARLVELEKTKTTLKGKE